MKTEDIARSTYSAYNRRDLDTALKHLDPCVTWDDGVGGILTGTDAVAAHWQEQWRDTAAMIHIDAIEFGDAAAATLCVDVTLAIRDASGAITERSVRNILEFSNEKIVSMRITARGLTAP